MLQTARFMLRPPKLRARAVDFPEGIVRTQIDRFTPWIEQSAIFTRATFFALTTRSPTEAAERVHIEAQIEQIYAPRS